MIFRNSVFLHDSDVLLEKSFLQHYFTAVVQTSGSTQPRGRPPLTVRAEATRHLAAGGGNAHRNPDGCALLNLPHVFLDAIYIVIAWDV